MAENLLPIRPSRMAAVHTRTAMGTGLTFPVTGRVRRTPARTKPQRSLLLTGTSHLTKDSINRRKSPVTGFRKTRCRKARGTR